jgi:hypothetical protein
MEPSLQESFERETSSTVIRYHPAENIGNTTMRRELVELTN